MYIARKRCRFSDREYYAGEIIPEALVDPNRAHALVRYGILEKAEKTAQKPPCEAHDATPGKKARRGAERAVATAKKGGRNA